jgi:NAD(P) transhydrogenase
LPPPPPPKEQKSVGPIVIDYRAPYVDGAKRAGYLGAGCLAVGCISPDPAFSAMFTTFALSNIIGVQVVLGVAHALHSPLMAVTNAISGTTALGGMHLLAHSNSASVTVLGALATTLSTVNIVGEYIFMDETGRNVNELIFSPLAP